jgi:hypothetical protein
MNCCEPTALSCLLSISATLTSVRTFLRRLEILLCLAGLVLSTGKADSGPPISEASGVTRQGDYLLIVDDSVPGAFFRMPIPQPLTPNLSLNTSDVQFVGWPEGKLAIDLEGIDILADGRLALLSERLHALVGEQGLIVEYDKIVSEFAGRGLEGVAVKSLPGEVSRVAVVWEGGYPQYPYVPLSLKQTAGRLAMKPLLLVHDLKPHVFGVTILRNDALKVAELDVPVPSGKEPEAQRFRATDLVWSRFQRMDRSEWGIVALLSSENSSGVRVYQYHWLQRFGLDGVPVGQHLDLVNLLPPPIQALNWEGMSWFERGKSLVLVHEGSHLQPSSAYILSLPTDWQFEWAE